MAVSPVNVSRVSFNQQITTLLTSLKSTSLDLLTEQNQLASGLKFASPSEDPAAASQALSLQAVISRQDQIAVNLDHASSMLDATDAAISEIHGLVSDAHAIASQSLGPLATAEERLANAELIADLVEQLVAVGNREFNGVYLFAGRDTESPPFESALGSYAYAGDTGDVLAHVAVLDDEPINLTGADLFGALSSSAGPGTDLSPVLSADTRLEDLVGARGEGVRVGRVAIQSEAGGAAITVDLTAAGSLGDIVDLINDAAGGLVTAALGPDSVTLTPVAGAVTVTDVGLTGVAGDLGLVTTAPSSDPIVGDSLRRKVTRTTPIDELAGGTGVDLTGGLTVTNGAQTRTVDVSTAQTVQDLINAINNSGLYVRARVNEAGTGIAVVNEVAGTRLSIGENGGTTAADLGLRTLDEDTVLAGLNFGRGVETSPGQDDIRITAKDGSILDLNLDGLQTLGEVLEAINSAAVDAGVAVTASLAETGNGIRLVDTTGGAEPLSVSRLNMSYALDDLGLVGAAEEPEGELLGTDVNTARADGLLTALVDLESALRADDERAITDAADRVSSFVDELNSVHGQVGARAQALHDRLDQTETAALATEQLLSEVRDLDYAEAVTRFQQTQLALQATLTAGSQSLNLSLMSFLG